MSSTRDDFITANIVFQIGDLLEAPGAKRQETNDQAIAFVDRLLKKHTAVELRRLLSQVEMLIRSRGFPHAIPGLEAAAGALRQRADELYPEEADRAALSVRITAAIKEATE